MMEQELADNQQHQKNENNAGIPFYPQQIPAKYESLNDEFEDDQTSHNRNPPTSSMDSSGLVEKQQKSANNRNSQRNTSATLSALDLSRVSTQPDHKLIPLYFGNHIPFLWIHGSPYFTIGPHWPFFVCLWIGILFSAILIAELIATQIVNPFWYYGEYVLAGFVLLFFTLSSLRNPGIAIEKENSSTSSYSIGNCTMCQVVLDNSTFHCFDCQVCIRGYDHHCPWTGKCIGQNNLILFRIFISLFALYFVFSMAVCVAFSL